MGIGLATGLAFGRAGAQAYLTYHWGSADEDAVRRAFAEAGALEPRIVQADASREEDTVALLEQVHREHEHVEVFVSNVCVVELVKDVESMTQKALFKSLEYSAWPLVAYVQEIRRVFGRCPRYIVGLSSDGPDRYYGGYDWVAVSKAVMEVLGRYLVRDLHDDDVRINMVRPRNVVTESAMTMHGPGYPEFVREHAGERCFVQPDEVGNVILALCSGLLDAMSGQVLSIDRGSAFQDGLLSRFHDSRASGPAAHAGAPADAGPQGGDT